MHYKEVTSTQDVLRELASHGAQPGTVVSADQQTHGRGRQGRPWVSLPPPQLYFSVLLEPQMPLGRLPILSIAAGLAVADAIEHEGIRGIGVKWPNDVYAGAKKVCGILAEAFPSPNATTFVALGIGVNISGSAADIPAEIRERATTLGLQSPRPVDRSKLRMSILDRFKTLYGLVVAGQIAPIQTSFRERWIYRDRPLRVEVGDRTHFGTATEIDEDGALILNDDRGARIRIATGEILPL